MNTTKHHVPKDYFIGQIISINHGSRNNTFLFRVSSLGPDKKPNRLTVINPAKETLNSAAFSQH